MGEVDAALVERFAHDRAFDAGIAQRGDVGFVGHAARCDDGKSRDRGQAGIERAVRAGKHAVAGDVGADDARRTARDQVPAEAHAVKSGIFRPARHGDAAVAQIDAHDHRFGPEARKVSRET